MNVRSCMKIVSGGVFALSVLLTHGQSQAATQIGQNEGNIDWNGWELDYDTFELADGLILKNVKYGGVPILGRASFPVMSVYYEGPCGPYADRLNGPQAQVQWANNELLVAREFEQEGKMWFELGIREFIGSYDIYQVWYLSEDGELDGHLFSRGLQCDYDHVHYPMWRLDFDLDGPANDRILRQTGENTFSTYDSEFQVPANDAFQHGWFVEDSITGYRVRVGFDSGAWNVAGTVVPETAYADNRVGGLVNRSTEEGWSGGASTNFPNVGSENILDTDVVMWYRGYLPHTPAEGSALWHSTGIRIFADQSLDTDGDGIPNSTDTDDDNDGVLDVDDDLPLDPSESVDTDGDGIGNNADLDDDGDGVNDADDAFPLDATESVDTDGDRIGDNADIDADNDGLPDSVETGLTTAVAMLENFESGSNWTVDPQNSDTATTGIWQVGNPQETSTSGTVLQNESASNGSQALITAITAGTSVGTNDVDNGDTTILSPIITLPASATELTLDYYFAHLDNATSADYLTITLEYAGGSRSWVDEAGTGINRAAVWTESVLDVADLAGNDVRIRVEVADSSTGSLIEAGVDHIRALSEFALDSDGDSIDNRVDLDSDNDSIPDIIEAGLTDADENYQVDNAAEQGTVQNPPDSDGDGLADYLDIESNNAANNGTAFDIATTPYVILDTNGDGQVDSGDAEGGQDFNGNGIDDAIEAGVNSCGDAAVDPTVDKALIIWNDCNDVIHVVGTGGLDSARYVGAVVSEDPLLNLSTESLEAGDIVENSPANKIAFDLKMGGGYSDSFQFNASPAADVCIAVNVLSAGTALLAGPNKTPVTSPFNPVTLQSCTIPGESGCGAPSVNAETDGGVFIWRECSGPWNLMATGDVGAGTGLYRGSISADSGIDSATPRTLETSDEVSVSNDVLNFSIITGNPWDDRFEFATSTDAQLCVDIDTLPAGLSVYVGADKTAAPSGPFDPVTLASCTPPTSECDAPTVDAANERALFSWIDCDGDLHLLGTGAAANANYKGHVYASAPLGDVTAESVESSDTLSLITADDLYFDISMGGPWVDEFVITPAAGSELCIAVDAQSIGTTLLAGASRTPVTSPFNPVTLASCTPPSSGVCGDAQIDSTVDAGLFVWRDCAGTWSLVVTGEESLELVNYIGTVTSSTGFASITPGAVEASDTVSTVLTAPLAFDLRTLHPWDDGLNFVPNADASLCVSLTTMPATLGRYTGPQRDAVSSLSFNPETGGTCE